MAATIIEIVTEYEQRVRRLPHVPALSYGRPMLRDDGAPSNVTAVTTHKNSSSLGLGRNVMTYSLLNSRLLWKSKLSHV
jgi:hypothetical protein